MRIAPAPPPIQASQGWVRKALDYTQPRPTTASNFAHPQIFQAASSATIEGFYMLGLAGAASNAVATVAGLRTQERFGKVAGALMGAATGAGLAAAASQLLHTGPAVTAAALGGLVGTYSTLRGNQESRFRDAGAFGLTFGSPLLSGGAKAGLGLASVLAEEFPNDGARALAAGALGAAAGVAFSLTGYASLSPALAGAACAGAAMFGAVAGPRVGMGMRNLTEDLGQRMVKPGQPQQPQKEKSMLARTAGILPMACLRQGVQATLMGRFDPASIATGVALDASMSAYEVYLNAKGR